MYFLLTPVGCKGIIEGTACFFEEDVQEQREVDNKHMVKLQILSALLTTHCVVCTSAHTADVVLLMNIMFWISCLYWVPLSLCKWLHINLIKFIRIIILPVWLHKIENISLRIVWSYTPEPPHEHFEGDPFACRWHISSDSFPWQQRYSPLLIPGSVFSYK